MFMDQSIRNVLVVGVEKEFHNRFQPLLERRRFDVDWVAHSASARALIRSVAIDVLVLRYPLADPPVEDLLKDIRSMESPCRKSSVLLLASRERLAAAAQLADGEKTRVLPIDADDETLQRTVASLLRTAPRLSVRMTIRLEAVLGDGSTMILTQTENVSRGGMLVRVRRPQPVDARLRFELLLPEDSAPVRGLGEVVRNTRDPQGRPIGVGIRFVSFKDDGKVRLGGYLRRIEKLA